jgi:hypothetical protein
MYDFPELPMSQRYHGSRFSDFAIMNVEEFEEDFVELERMFSGELEDDDPLDFSNFGEDEDEDIFS